MYVLLNWFLRNIPQIGIIAEGNVINNPKFYSGQNICTSKIERVAIDNENKQFIFITHSGSSYIAKFEEINMKLIEDMKDSFNQLNVPNDYLDICENTYKTTKDRLNKYIGDILNPNELYIEIVGIVFKKAFFMTDKREIKEIPIKVHIGTFQDSVLITDFDNNSIDIRFWDISNNAICSYRWNEELEAIKIYNIGDDITYKKDELKITLKHNELTEIKRDNTNIAR